MTTTLVKQEPRHVGTPGGGELSGDEASRLRQLEQVIEREMAAWVKVGVALEEIHARRLYRASHVNFCDYLRDRWELSYRHARRLMLAALVVQVLPAGDRPAVEVHARELLPLRANPEMVVEAWHAAVETGRGHPTANVVRQAVTRVLDATGEAGAGRLVREGTAKPCRLDEARRRFRYTLGVVHRLTTRYGPRDLATMLRPDELASVAGVADRFSAWAAEVTGQDAVRRAGTGQNGASSAAGSSVAGEDRRSRAARLRLDVVAALDRLLEVAPTDAVAQTARSLMLGRGR